MARVSRIGRDEPCKTDGGFLRDKALKSRVANLTWEQLMDSIKPVFTAVASVTGGRNGHAEAEDHSVSVNLSVPKAMGGPGKPGATTPEHLFAAGYAACFGGAIDYVATQQKKARRMQRLPAVYQSDHATRVDSGWQSSCMLRIRVCLRPSYQHWQVRHMRRFVLTHTPREETFR
jgi:Ohr subfamily peroxiredoxin